MLSEREMLGEVGRLTEEVRRGVAAEPMTPLERLRWSNRFEGPDRVPLEETPPVHLETRISAARRFGTYPTQPA